MCCFGTCVRYVGRSNLRRNSRRWDALRHLGVCCAWVALSVPLVSVLLSYASVSVFFLSSVLILYFFCVFLIGVFLFFSFDSFSLMRLFFNPTFFVHFGLLRFSSATALRALRKQLRTRQTHNDSLSVPRVGPRFSPKNGVFNFDSKSKCWLVPFPGSDASVV